MNQLYSLTYNKDKQKQELYIKDNNGCLDFITYFNSFSLKKWKQYTTIQTVALNLQISGKWKIIWKLIDESKEKIFLEEICDTAVYQHEFPIEELSGIILGFELEPLTKDAEFQNGAWYGTFAEWEDKQIGISICTFKREKYVKQTMSLLKAFQKTHSWLSILVVDNGSTLQETEEDSFRVVHNPNYGGSGGFTRGMIEYVDEGKVNYVLLMDDDIVLEPSSLERSYSLLCGLREQYKESFLSGAMLRLEEPMIQHENTAHWGKIRLHSFGQGFDLTKISCLAENEKNLSKKNRYGAWWYCCLPLDRIQKIGYPLPVFVKGDDMEYGIRNHREVIHMNGIGVWHQSFQSKISPVVNYYSDRNMLIINNYADGCGWCTFIVAVIGRLLKRSLQGSFKGLYCLYQALIDYNRGFSKIPLNKKMQEVTMILSQDVHGVIIAKIFWQVIKSILLYPHTSLVYKNFQNIYLKNSKFWKDYLNMAE